MGQGSSSGGFVGEDDMSPPGGSSSRSSNADQWFYVSGGAKAGPVSAVQVKERLNRGEINTETSVWREGMRGWTPLRDSDLRGLVATEPPPVSNTLVRNGPVWTVAILPLAVAVIDASIAQNNQDSFAGWMAFGTPVQHTGQIPWVILSLINAALCLWDCNRLKKAGYQNKWMLATAFALAPIYLFLRARILSQRPTYAIGWLVATFIGLLITAS